MDGSGPPRSHWLRDRRLGRWAVAASLAVILSAMAWLPTGYLVVYPGPVRSLEGLVSVEGKARPATSFFMVAVIAREASGFDVVRASFDPEADVWSKREVYRGRTPREYAEENELLMASSKETAALAAFRACGLDVRQGQRLPPGYSIESGEVLGPSAGLAFALEMVATVSGEDLTRGRKVAATGFVDSSGEVGPVGGIAQKTIACRESGVEVFIVPLAEVPDASRLAGPMKVAGAGDLASALEFLRAP